MLRLDDDASKMYYTGQGKDDSKSIGAEWSREQAQFSFINQALLVFLNLNLNLEETLRSNRCTTSQIK